MSQGRWINCKGEAESLRQRSYREDDRTRENDVLEVDSRDAWHKMAKFCFGWSTQSSPGY